MHVDEWINDMGFDDKPEHGNIMYARWMMLQFRFPAYMQMNFKKFIEDRKLFCTYEGLRFRCTGGSRMGDVWLAKDFNQDTGYDKRVEVEKCFQWSEAQ